MGELKMTGAKRWSRMLNEYTEWTTNGVITPSTQYIEKNVNAIYSLIKSQPDEEFCNWYRDCEQGENPRAASLRTEDAQKRYAEDIQKIQQSSNSIQTCLNMFNKNRMRFEADSEGNLSLADPQLDSEDKSQSVEIPNFEIEREDKPHEHYMYVDTEQQLIEYVTEAKTKVDEDVEEFAVSLYDFLYERVPRHRENLENLTITSCLNKFHRDAMKTIRFEDIAKDLNILDDAFYWIPEHDSEDAEKYDCYRNTKTGGRTSLEKRDGKRSLHEIITEISGKKIAEVMAVHAGLVRDETATDEDGETQRILNNFIQLVKNPSGGLSEHQIAVDLFNILNGTIPRHCAGQPPVCPPATRRRRLTGIEARLHKDLLSLITEMK